MMPLEQQVCSHELAKRLAELGVRQESVFWWVDRKLTYTGGRASHAQLQGGIAAFTVAEVGEILPDEITIPSKNGKPHTHIHIGYGLVAIAAQGIVFVCLPWRDRADESRGTRAHRSGRPCETLDLLIGTSFSLLDGTPCLKQDGQVMMRNKVQ
jgi:hypothetical protein